MLSPVLAQQIAGETTEAIGHNVIITDSDAIVIGSGDQSRVGSLHEASIEVIATQESAWHDPEQARRLRGVRPGITLPLMIDGEAVGTVGITGSPRQVRRFGLLVRRQTEILLEESALLRNRLLRERALEDLIGEIVGFTPGSSDPALLEATAHDLSLSLAVARQPLVVETSAPPIGPEFLRTVRAVFHHREDVAARRSTNTCLVLMHVSSRSDRSASEEATRLIEALEERFTGQASVGLGEPVRALAQLPQACRDAADALRLGVRVAPDGKLHDIRDLRARQALLSVPPAGRERLMTGTLRDLPERSDWPVLRETVLAWCESGFNLVEAASSLTIHRNTLLYRLRKLEQLLGRPWRDHRHMLDLYVACIVDHADAGAGPQRG